MKNFRRIRVRGLFIKFQDLNKSLPGTVLRSELRPGDHYNILFGIRGLFLFIQSLYTQT